MSHFTTSLSCAAALLAALASPSRAQNLMQTDGQVVAQAGAAVPGTASATYKAGGGVFDTPVLDATGRVLFRAQLIGGDTTTANDRALIYGDVSTATVMIRGSDQAPGLPAGITLSQNTGSSGFTSVYRVGPSGEALFTSRVWFAGTNTQTDTAVFVGPPSSLVPLVREGDPAPGTAGAIINTDFTMVVEHATSTTAVNSAGKYLFHALLTGGDTVATGVANNSGIYLGTPGSLDLVVRKGDVMADPPLEGLRLSALVSIASPYTAQLNAAGQVLWECSYSTLAGTPLPTTSTNQAVYLTSPTGPGTYSHALIAREGSPVGPALPGVSYGLSTSTTTVWGISGTSLDAAGNVLFKAEVQGGGTTTVDDTAIFWRPAGGPTALVLRENDQAAGLPVGTRFAVSTNSSLQLNNSGRYSLLSTLSGTGVTTANDSSLWSGVAPAAPALVARESDPAPGTTGAAFGSISPASLALNDCDQMVFLASLTGGDVAGTANDQALYLWSPATGAVLISREGDALPQLAAVVSSWSIYQDDNTANGTLGFNNQGRLVTRLGLVGGNQAIVVLDTKPKAVPYCFGDGTGTSCPCSPVPVPHGTAGKGCPNNLFLGGAELTAGGFSSLAADTLVMNAFGMPNGGGCLVYQGLTDNGGGLGVVFGDGLRCAGGTTARLKVHLVAGNAYQYPDPAFGDNATSIRGGVLVPGDRYYQAWYRSANPTFCTSGLFNLTNALKVTWVL